MSAGRENRPGTRIIQVPRSSTAIEFFVCETPRKNYWLGIDREGMEQEILEIDAQSGRLLDLLKHVSWCPAQPRNDKSGLGWGELPAPPKYQMEVAGKELVVFGYSGNVLILSILNADSKQLLVHFSTGFVASCPNFHMDSGEMPKFWTYGR